LASYQRVDALAVADPASSAYDTLRRRELGVETNRHLEDANGALEDDSIAVGERSVNTQRVRIDDALSGPIALIFLKSLRGLPTPA
jgi:hypothetical protein